MYILIHSPELRLFWDINPYDWHHSSDIAVRYNPPTVPLLLSYSHVSLIIPYYAPLCDRFCCHSQ